MEYIIMILSCVLVNNIILAQFLGICSFLGVSNKVSTSLGMGMAVIFVMALSTLVTSLLQKYLLVPFNLTFLQTIVFILVIATLVQMVEIILKKISPPLYQALGIFLPLISTNCAILGIAILVTQKPDFSLLDSTLYAIFTAIGYTVAIVIFAGLREQLSLVKVPKKLDGVPIALIISGILAMAFMGFANLV
ncbi:MAG TPA: RnfABCDGE type electron transport complex subunit A [Bacteroidales bacterium]|jgi:electron transport complex protein RnfA|nr:RnfABCDGE type electron transport complex subunit A [Bacteroidales bacterium]HOS57025.1 RnfABCDGE type electron transport complex subunit A [Bacteroidales bacterium]HPY81167.1 RnfABCDGE type electron transport complex subunit A [Bacteroidales bacterium]HRR04805.1 RnfABCDGE type electron transport complex subunit A [Bacteroidales bacterium]HRT13116.1 RnfABCDGE type electron transport complex subunit A [Bacteroidales bacterium]